LKRNFKYWVSRFFKLIFTIDKETIKSCQKENTRNHHLKYRLLLLIVLSPILYVLLFSDFHNSGFTFMNIFRVILTLLMFRIIAKELTDTIIVLFFYKSSYNLSLKEIRKFKLRRLNKKSR